MEMRLDTSVHKLTFRVEKDGCGIGNGGREFYGWMVVVQFLDKVFQLLTSMSLQRENVIDKAPPD